MLGSGKRVVWQSKGETPLLRPCGPSLILSQPTTTVPYRVYVLQYENWRETYTYVRVCRFADWTLANAESDPEKWCVSSTRGERTADIFQHTSSPERRNQKSPFASCCRQLSLVLCLSALIQDTMKFSHLALVVVSASSFGSAYSFGVSSNRGFGFGSTTSLKMVSVLSSTYVDWRTWSIYFEIRYDTITLLVFPYTNLYCTVLYRSHR